MTENYKPCSKDITYCNVPNGKLKRRAVCAANRINGLIICGARHWDPIMNAVADALKTTEQMDGKAEQGFIDQWGNFMTREEAAKVARVQETQLRDDNFGKILFSENLY